LKTIDTLIPDMLKVVSGEGDWDDAVSKFLSEQISLSAYERFKEPQKPRGYLGLSSVGKPCKRQIWYDVNTPEKGEPFTAKTLGNFFYGDIIERFVLSLIMASGHSMEGLQQQLDVFGIKGHGDVIIDGRVVDVKSASSYSFEKFKKNNIREDDPFGYISQLSSYLYGYKDDPRVTDKTKASFLVIKKDKFDICLDTYDLTEELAKKEQEIENIKRVVKDAVPPPKRWDDEPDGKSGNMKLGTGCSYCNHKNHCWPNIRTFLYSTGPRYLTRVIRVPDVPELKGAED